MMLWVMYTFTDTLANIYCDLLDNILHSKKCGKVWVILKFIISYYYYFLLKSAIYNLAPFHDKAIVYKSVCSL